MKIKGASDKICGRHIFLVFALLLVVLGALRGCIVALLVDSGTGFYEKESFLITVFNILLAFSFVIPVLSFLSKECNRVDVAAEKDKLLGVAFVLLSLTFVYDSIQAFSFSGDSGTGVQLTAKAMMAAGVFAGLFRGIAAIFSFVYFLSVSKAYLKGDMSFAKRKLIALSPVVWAGARMIGLFVKQISFVNVSDLFLELLALACMIIFFMAFAQVSSGIYSDEVRWRIFGFGLVAALISIVLHLSKICIYVAEPQASLIDEYPIVITDVVFGFVMFMLALKSFGNKNRVSSDEGE